eukprot:scaffold20384_cov72-Cyclotella_meneghiniana.AAC.2
MQVSSTILIIKAGNGSSSLQPPPAPPLSSSYSLHSTALSRSGRVVLLGNSGYLANYPTISNAGHKGQESRSCHKNTSWIILERDNRGALITSTPANLHPRKNGNFCSN